MYRIIILLLSTIFLASCQNWQTQSPQNAQTPKLERIEGKNVLTGELIHYANNVPLLSVNKLEQKVYELESKISKQKSFENSIKLAFLLSYADLPHRNNHRALEVLAAIDTKNRAETDFIVFFVNLLEERINPSQRIVSESGENGNKSYYMLLREQKRLMSELDKERKQRKELQGQLEALMKLEKNINKRETQDNNVQ